MKIRTKEELDLMRESGRISAKALKRAMEIAGVGRNLLEIEDAISDEIRRGGGEPSFKTVPGYFWSSCLCVNNEVVHSIPRDYILKKGDLLTIDLGTVFKGWHTDCAWSVLIGGGESRFLMAGQRALWAGIGECKEGKKVGDISAATQKVIEGEFGYKIVKSLTGHGVGKELHEEPSIPGYGKAGTGIDLMAGMTLAIEPIYTETTDEVTERVDGWTIVSKDGSLGSCFEMSIVVGKDKPEVLTDWRKV